jgi:hypothetical protein
MDKDPHKQSKAHAMATTRSMTREVLAYPFTLHPNALRKLGVAIPEAEPALAPSRPEWVPSFAPKWDYDDYSPTSPSRE